MPPTPSSPEPVSSESKEHLKVLLVDDDRELASLIQEYLAPVGYEVTAVHTGSEGLEEALSGKYQAMILDYMLPGMDGIQVLKRVRQKSALPILMLTARGDETDRIIGLEMGADDYVPKTFSSRELLARLRAITRRAIQKAHPDASAEDASAVTVGDLFIHPETHVAKLKDRPLQLTALEFELLLCLARARGRVKSREDLIRAIADRDYDVFDRSIDVHIWSLRRKLGDDPKNPHYIRTIRAVGYMLINPNA